MNSRERVRLILNHQEADRPAIDLGATSVSGTSAWTYQAFKDALGIANSHVRVFDLFQMLAEVEPDVKDALGCDFTLLPKDTLMLGLKYGEWKPYTFWTGQTFEVPAGFDPQLTRGGALMHPFQPGQPQMMRMPKGGRFFDFVPDSKADPMYVHHIPESDWTFQEELDEGFLKSEQAKAKALYESTDRAIFAEPPLSAPCGYCGLYQWAMKLCMEPEHCREWMMRAGEAAAKCYRQYLQAVGDYVDVIAVCLADFGEQNHEMFSPDLFAEYYVPAWRLVTDAIHESSRAKAWIHCCGSVPNLIPHFIAARVDCLNPVQWTAANMDLKDLKTKYGDRLVFWGGAISTQRTFPFGTPDEVRAEAKEVLEVMAPGGGYVATPIHNILPEVPVDNIVALYETAREWRYRPTSAPIHRDSVAER